MGSVVKEFLATMQYFSSVEMQNCADCNLLLSEKHVRPNKISSVNYNCMKDGSITGSGHVKYTRMYMCSS